MLVFEKDKAYMEVLCEFRKMIDSEFKEGGWLPPVRELSKRFNVSTIQTIYWNRTRTPSFL